MNSKSSTVNTKIFFLTMIVSLALLAVLLVGCNSGNTTNDEQTQTQQSSSEESISYPEEPINLIIGFNPGGGHDNNARALGQYFEEEFGVPLTYVYKPGAAGAVGASEMAKAKADGYTMMVHGYQDLVIQPLTGSGDYKTEDFEFIGQVTSDPTVLAALKDSKFKTVEDFINEAKKNPGKLTVGYFPITPSHFALLELINLTGINVTLVPYQGGAEAKSMLLGGHIDLGMANLGPLTSDIDKFSFLGVATEEPFVLIPDVPTFKEQGYDIISEMCRTYVVPKGTPEEIINRLREGFKNIVDNPDYQKDMLNIGQPVDWFSGEEFEKEVYDYQGYVKKLIETNNLLKK